MFEFYKHLITDDLSSLHPPSCIATTFIRSSSSSSLILHASKNEGLESGFEVDSLGKAVHGFPSGRYFKKVDQCLLALFFPDVAGVSSKNIQQAGPSRDRRNEKAYLYLDGQYHKEVSFFCSPSFENKTG